MSSLSIDSTNEFNNTDNNIIGHEISSLIMQEPFKFYIFPIPFEQMWHLVKDPSKFSLITNNIVPGVFVNPIKISKNQFLEINNEFLIEIDDTIEINFTTIEIVETDYYCKVKWNISTNINNTSFTLIVNLSKIDPEHTLYQLSFIKPKPSTAITSNSKNTSSPSYQVTLSILVNKRFNIYSYYTKLDNCINTSFQTQTESSVISANFFMAKEYFLNARICTQMMGEYVSSTEERVKKGTIATYINNKDNKKWLIHIRQCVIKKSSCFLMLFIYEAHRSAYPIRELRVELFDVNDNETFVVLTHNMLKKLPQEEIQALSIAKKKMLKKLGSIIERSFKLNYLGIGNDRE